MCDWMKQKIQAQRQRREKGQWSGVAYCDCEKCLKVSGFSSTQQEKKTQ